MTPTIAAETIIYSIGVGRSLPPHPPNVSQTLSGALGLCLKRSDVDFMEWDRSKNSLVSNIRS